ncbi:hypothetical protein H257_13470 [Aphanomyces astaci]|uniref:Uncharacterized protein n=1 Tax=Aphanomyces astaci TaxID=112090 RepID=W4FU89_APHAT|nr:hypothetical protein H257_13470 [Aphanomyces astaci]ETV71045.1 hypothetical protein H257_13470 [Aphanomyces astaci]|eukprot:XP_009839291.1 hypothetical protein H257_13470 [Aphanomyces astaci]
MDPDEFVGDSQSEDDSFWNEVDQITQLAMEKVTSTTLTSVSAAVSPTPALDVVAALDGMVAESLPRRFNEGDLVEVENRTWPGINKIGGAARVTRAYDEDGMAVVDVRYFLGGSERAVAIEYVQPSAIFEKKSRQRRSRNFFHDEFADEYLPSRRQLVDTTTLDTITRAPPATDPTIETVDVHTKPAARKVAKKTVATGASTDLTNDTFDRDSSMSDDDDDTPLYRRFHNLGKLVKPSTAPTPATRQDLPTDTHRSHALTDGITSVLESHSVGPSPSAENVGARAPSSPVTIDLWSSDDGDDSRLSPQRRRHHHPHLPRRHKKRKRRHFVGGYDGDNNFIQPEDNAMDLPDDVQQDTGFALAKTTKELKLQYQQHATAFELALQTFESMRSGQIDASSNLRELERFHKQHLVREEDIVDAILRKLEANGKSVSAVENLKHDQRKSQVNEYAVWVKGRRESALAVDPTSEDEGSGGSLSSESSEAGSDRWRQSRPTIDRPRRAKSATTVAASSLSSDELSDSDGNERVRGAASTKPQANTPRMFSAEESIPNMLFHASMHRNGRLDDQSSKPLLRRRKPSAFTYTRQTNKLPESIHSTTSIDREEYLPRTIRNIPPSILASSEWNWKGLLRHKRRASQQHEGTGAPRTKRHSSKHPSKWKLRVYRAPVHPGGHSTATNLRRPQHKQPPVLNSPPPTPALGTHDLDPAVSSILQYTSDVIPSGWQPTQDELALLKTVLVVPDAQSSLNLPPWYHSPLPLFARTLGLVTKLIRTLRHGLVDLQHAEGTFMEQQAGASELIEVATLERMSQKCTALMSELYRLHTTLEPINLDEIRWLLDSLPRIHTLLATSPSYYFYFERTESSSTVFLHTMCTLYRHALDMDPPGMLDRTLLFLIEYHMHFTPVGKEARSVLSLWQCVLSHQPDLWSTLCFQHLAQNPTVKALAKSVYPHATTGPEIDMLVRETIWDVVVWLSPMPDKTLASNWMLVGGLLSGSDALPFSHTFRASITSDALIEMYRQRILQRMLVLSAAWAPSHVPVVMLVLKLMQSPPRIKSPRLPSFLMELALEPTERDAILTYDIDASDCSDLMGRVIVMQMIQFDKPVLRNRFRHPVLNALKHQPRQDQSTAETTKWNWTNPMQKPADPLPPAPPSVESPSPNHVRHIVLVSMVLATIMTDELKSFKRDLTFYTNEILRAAAPGNPTTAMHALWIIMTAMKAHLPLMPSLLSACNDLLVQMTKQSSPQESVDAIEFALHCLLQVAKHLVQTAVDSTSLRPLAECVQGILNTGFDHVLQLCFKKVLPRSVLSMATSILVCLCPHTPMTPPPSPSTEFDEFDDPEEMALLASLDAVNSSTSGIVVTLNYRHVLAECADGVVKLLRVSLQRLALQEFASTAVLTAVGVLLAHATTFQWDILQASSTGPTVFVFSRVLATAISNGPTHYMEHFLATHNKPDVALVQVWLLTLMDPCPTYWNAWAGRFSSCSQPATSLLHVLTGCTVTLTSKSSSFGMQYDQRTSAFRRFCTNVLDRYNSAGGDHANTLRSIVLDLHHGVLASWVDACSASLQSLCKHTSPDWTYLEALFADSGDYRQHEKQWVASPSVKSNATLATIQYCHVVYAYLSSVFSVWGGLARGTHLIFATFLQEFFPCAAYAQHDHAAAHLFASTLLFRTKPTAKSNWFGSKLDKPWVSAVETLRSFFSISVAPSLLTWVATTAPAYHLYTGGYASSPLRTFVLNVLDPEGPLGLASYYPIVDAHVALSRVKRESDYVACGLYDCPSHQPPHHSNDSNNQNALRLYLLNVSMPQYVQSLQDVGDLCPVLQLLRASACHANQYCGHELTPVDFVVSLQACVEVLLPTFACDLTATMCVLHVELVEWVERCLEANKTVGDPTMEAMVQLVVLRSLKLWSLLEPEKGIPVRLEHEHEFMRIHHRLTDQCSFTFRTLPSRTGSSGLNVFRAKGDVLATVKRFVRVAQASGDSTVRRLVSSD